jgi:hypothetical protein
MHNLVHLHAGSLLGFTLVVFTFVAVGFVVAVAIDKSK